MEGTHDAPINMLLIRGDLARGDFIKLGDVAALLMPLTLLTLPMLLLVLLLLGCGEVPASLPLCIGSVGTNAIITEHVPTQ